MSVTSYGAGDDLIKVEGDVDEEFTGAAASTDGAVLAIPDGTVVRVRRDGNGVWRINPVARGGRLLSLKQAPREDDEDNYSDHATIHGLITWVVPGNSIATATANWAISRPPGRN
ncbi:MAG: hypothetical protein LC776_19770 [Acidobacteria bacterium]|nr:hypothetical protein [Acidobacteriota bacterium]